MKPAEKSRPSQTEEALQMTLKRLKAYRHGDRNFEHAIETFVDAEATHGKREDPMVGSRNGSPDKRNGN